MGFLHDIFENVIANRIDAIVFGPPGLWLLALAMTRLKAVQTWMTTHPRISLYATIVFTSLAVSSASVAVTFKLLAPFDLKGPVGPAGPPGPPGPAAQPDDRLRIVVTAIARREWHVQQKSTFDRAYLDWKTRQQGELNRIRDAGILGTPSIIGHMMGINSDMEIIVAYQATFHENIDLHLHPNFDRNPYLKVGGSEQIKDDFTRTEYARKTDEFNTAVAKLDLSQQELENRIGEDERVVLNFGSSTQ